MRYEAAVSISDKGMIMNAIYLNLYRASFSTQHWHSEVNGSPAAPATHLAADLPVHVYLLQSEFLLQVVLGGGVLIMEGEIVDVGGAADDVVVGGAVVGTAALGSHP
jgi:hypothetical protein